ncbi:acetylornithine deacetylase [Aliidongia dinghuensis]|uniref:Acetylornithine deacetylase n=1 Tax=Aliidongia dinghuensis TaxID=1867774 RepID=A0A8J2YYC6_9PROT|nr:acetylornithine deacetylase [Aliidongia dinghuensis]GGF39803.1 acetylornithine deacetylase [Aliidongia dinghuensis]
MDTAHDRALFDRLIGFDTTSAKSNLALIDWAANYLDGHGIATRLTYDADQQKANLFATIGPEIPGGVVLSGHTDVVPVDGQDWSSDPFRLVERDGKFYGRGTADMKGFIALALARAERFKQQARRVPIHYAFSFDEEVGCHGVRHLLADLPTGERRPRLAIIGEPTLMTVANAHKGATILTTRITGLEGHSSAPDKGVNAIMAGAEILQLIGRMAEERKAKPVAGSPFEPPYTTFNVGVIEGGTAHNIVARDCRIVWQYRLMPGDHDHDIKERLGRFVEDELLPRMRRVHPGAAIVTEADIDLPCLVPEPEGAAEALVRELTGANGTSVVSFGTEAGLFQEAGMSAVVCGPGSIEQAHKADEFISLDQFAQGGRFLDRLGDWVAKQ